MNHIPISFSYQGRNYWGYFQPVCGAGVEVYHLIIDKFYYGRLRKANDKWIFDPSRFGMDELSEWFGEQVSSFETLK